jgi:hypothetical protein
MTREQQLALMEEARAARRAAQQVAEAADAQMLTLPLRGMSDEAQVQSRPIGSSCPSQAG